MQEPFFASTGLGKTQSSIGPVVDGICIRGETITQILLISMDNTHVCWCAYFELGTLLNTGSHYVWIYNIQENLCSWIQQCTFFLFTCMYALCFHKSFKLKILLKSMYLMGWADLKIREADLCLLLIGFINGQVNLLMYFQYQICGFYYMSFHISCLYQLLNELSIICHNNNEI